LAIVAEMRELCAVLRQNALLTKNNGLLLKRHTARMNALLLDVTLMLRPKLAQRKRRVCR
jgi:hypothetical protein